MPLKRYPWPDPVRYHGFGTPTISSAVGQHDVRFIYFLQQGDLVKVGMAKDVKQRLESFRLGSPRGLHLRGHREVPGPLVRQVERRIHGALDEWAVGREWFRTTPVHARKVAEPIIKAAFRAHQQFREDGYWSREYEPPPAPPAAMACGLLEPEIVGCDVDEAWLAALASWSPTLPQAAALIAVDVPKLLSQLAAEATIRPDYSLKEGEVYVVDMATHQYGGAVALIEAALSVTYIKHMHARWDRSGLYGFEVPVSWVKLQVPELRDPPPPPTPDITELLHQRRSEKAATNKKRVVRQRRPAAPERPPPLPEAPRIPTRKMSKILQHYLESRGLPI